MPFTAWKAAAWKGIDFLNSGVTEIIFGAGGTATEPLVVEALEGNAMIVLESEDETIARFKISHFYTLAPPVDLAPWPLFPREATSADNILSLDPDQAPCGFVNLETGEFTAYLKGIITSGLFGPLLPIRPILPRSGADGTRRPR